MDDIHFKKWDFFKIGVIALAALPVIILGAYIPRPYVPIVGRLRMTIVYPLLIFAAFAVVPNGMNMIDLVNGIMLYSQVLLMITILIWTYILGNYFIFALGLMYLGALLALFMFNKYPAKYFVSNTGSYGTGAITTAFVIYSRLEFVAIIALLPMILNSFSLLATLRNILTREDIQKTVGASNIRENGIIRPNPNPRAPLNIVRMIVIHEPCDEWEVVKVLYVIFLFSTILANITAYLIYIAKII